MEHIEVPSLLQAAGQSIRRQKEVPDAFDGRKRKKAWAK
jgi:hypothetical protein